MTITQFSLQHFRNFPQLQIEPSPKLNIVYGDNGSGKTNLMEAIYFLGRARSFRTSHLHHLISHGQQAFICYGKICDQHNTLHNLGIRRQSHEQTIKIDGAHIQRASDLARILPLQMINNDVHHLIDGGPKIRRQFLDWGAFHLYPQFAQLMKNFRHCLKQRNAALKKKWQRQDIQFWDKNLVEHAQQIDVLRREYLNQFQPELTALLEDSFNLPQLKISYRSGWDKNLDYAEALASSWDSDIQRGITHCGPHKAELRLTSDNQSLKEVISRGQQKILATHFVLAQVMLYQNKDKNTQRETLVLLIDDLPAELDKQFSAYFIKKILETNTQVFITATDYQLLDIPRSVSAKVFHVEHGVLNEVSFPHLFPTSLPST